MHFVRRVRARNRQAQAPRNSASKQQAARQPRGFGYGHIGARADVRGYEDRHFFDTIPTPLGPMTVAIVADGVGGSGFGERAAEVAIRATVHALKRTQQKNILKAMGEAIGFANKQVYRIAQQYRDRSRRDMGTTLAMAVIHDNRLYVANVGDSRVYLLRGDDLRQITIDHSWANERSRYQGLPLQEALQHPNAQLLMRSLGREPKVQVDLGLYLNGLQDHGPQAAKNQGLPLKGDEIILVCSDGLVKNRPGSSQPLLSKQEMIEILQAGDARQSAKMLVDTAVSRGADDNVTAVVVEMPDHRPKRALLQRASPKVLLSAALLVAVILSFTLYAIGKPLLESLVAESEIFSPPEGQVRVESAQSANIGVGPQAQPLLKGVRLQRDYSDLMQTGPTGYLLLRLRPNHYIEVGSNTQFLVGMDEEWPFGGQAIVQRLQANLQEETQASDAFVFYQPVLLYQGALIVRTSPDQKAQFDIFLEDRGYGFRAEGTVLGVCYRPPIARADCFEGTCSVFFPGQQNAEPVPAGQAIVLDFGQDTRRTTQADYTLQDCYQGLAGKYVPTLTPTPKQPTPTLLPTPTPTFTPRPLPTEGAVQPSANPSNDEEEVPDFTPTSVPMMETPTPETPTPVPMTETPTPVPTTETPTPVPTTPPSPTPWPTATEGTGTGGGGKKGPVVDLLSAVFQPTPQLTPTPPPAAGWSADGSHGPRLQVLRGWCAKAPRQGRYEAGMGWLPMTPWSLFAWVADGRP